MPLQLCESSSPVGKPYSHFKASQLGTLPSKATEDELLSQTHFQCCADVPSVSSYPLAQLTTHGSPNSTSLQLSLMPAVVGTSLGQISGVHAGGVPDKEPEVEHS